MTEGIPVRLAVLRPLIVSVAIVAAWFVRKAWRNQVIEVSHLLSGAVMILICVCAITALQVIRKRILSWLEVFIWSLVSLLFFAVLVAIAVSIDSHQPIFTR